MAISKGHTIASSHCEAKPTTLKRLSPGDGFENHMCDIGTRSNMECGFHINKLMAYFKS